MREEEVVFGALPPTAAMTFLSFCGIGGWSLWQKSKGSAEETSLVDAH
jgi:hypothetical protein